ncbi:MAG: hypothetical protein ACLVEV_03805 [Lachnospiraceae bacterium]|uniref:hypothetical protein n=1 Tax=Parablautia sp. Marseille-Q6255 TaxID=3039593 RepID=UPI0024BBF60F|nr:hypothetical protein [Parablautia sp. Marseille-Q6255]
MSDLRPRGVPIVIGGVERRILFTLNAIDAIESKYDKPLSDVLDMIVEGTLSDHVLRDVLMILLEDDAERTHYEHPEKEIAPPTEKEIGWFIGLDNQYLVMGLIFKAYGDSIPEPDGDDPNQESGRQNG